MAILLVAEHNNHALNGATAKALTAAKALGGPVHGFAVERESLPNTVEETHVSLFDGSNCGIRLKGRPVFSVQYHPEASPGPQDSHYLFIRFVNMMRERRRFPADSERGSRLS